MTRVEREYAARVLEQINYVQCTGDPTIDEQRRAVDTAIAALRGPEWVRTADRLPLHFSNTLVVMGGKITLGLYDCNCWFFYNEDKNKWEMDEYDRVTHWMPLPKLPEVEE